MTYSTRLDQKRLDQILKGTNISQAKEILGTTLVDNEEATILSSRVWDIFFRNRAHDHAASSRTPRIQQVSKAELDRHGRVIRYDSFRDMKSKHGWFLIFKDSDLSRTRDPYNLEPVSLETLYEVIAERAKEIMNKS